MSEDKRERLVGMALRQFLHHGYAGSGIKDVVDAAGIPKGSFHYYFDSKESLGIAAIERYSQKNHELRSRLLLLDRSVPPLERLRGYFTEYARGHEKARLAGGCLLGNMSAEVADHSKLLRRSIQSGFEAWQAMVRSVLDEAVERKDLAAGFPTEQIAGFLVNGWEGALLRMKAEKSNEPLQTFISTVFDRLLTKA